MSVCLGFFKQVKKWLCVFGLVVITHKNDFIDNYTIKNQ